MPTRDEMWDRLSENVEYDMLVIGGGITGSGIARDAVRRGYSVALVEMNDLAFGTSSRSSKLVHGGLRYLEQYEFGMVFESVSERRVLMDLAPHLVNPLGFLFPVYKGATKKRWVINAGMWIYDGLSLFRSPKRHRNLDVNEVAKIEPGLLREGLTGAPMYYDCSTDDARLTLETALDAAEHGAVIATGAKVERLIVSQGGRACGAVVSDTVGGGASKSVRARVVINATGPWTDRIVAMSPTPGTRQKSLLRPTKGVHIVVDAQKLPIKHAIVCRHPEDGRVLFVLPWGNRTYLGTTDTDEPVDPSEVAATSDDVDYLIAIARHYFPDTPITREDVIATWAGLRPLVAPQESGVSESEVSREHEIIVGRNGLVTIAGGKLTTYRRMAAEVVDRAELLLRLSGEKARSQPARTEHDPLVGGVGWPDDDDHEKVATEVMDAAAQPISFETALHLAGAYGMRALELVEGLEEGEERLLVEGQNDILGQVRWAFEQELATTVSDVLIRRTQVFYRDVDQGLSVANEVAEILGSKMGWSELQKKESADAYRADVARSRAWKNE